MSLGNTRARTAVNWANNLPLLSLTTNIAPAISYAPTEPAAPYPDHSLSRCRALHTCWASHGPSLLDVERFSRRRFMPIAPYPLHSHPVCKLSLLVSGILTSSRLRQSLELVPCSGEVCRVRALSSSQLQLAPWSARFRD
jgi:hypothetical protein